MKLRSLMIQWLINHVYHLPKAIIANLIFGFPSRDMIVIGVTGTDGKTTTATLIHHILTDNDYRAALISSVSASYDRKEIGTGLHVTSPDPLVLQKIIRDVRRHQCRYLVLETTSHGIDQFRCWGITYRLAVLTNITPEHLDYHRNYDRYLKTKVRLLQKSRLAIINRDDGSYPAVKKLLGRHAAVSYGLQRGDYRLSNLPVKSGLPGDYNQQNCLAAAAACLKLGLEKSAVLRSVASFKTVCGRMDMIPNRRRLQVVVDFAHTPNGLKNALQALRQKSAGQLIAVFGCAGCRDYLKRPRMGEISGKLADMTVLTAEDPRTEKIETINRAIEQGLQTAGALKSDYRTSQRTARDKQKHRYFLIPDRQAAINFAVNVLAKPGDTVGIFGKGHEQSLCFGRTEYPWSDHAAVRKALGT